MNSGKIVDIAIIALFAVLFSSVGLRYYGDKIPFLNPPKYSFDANVSYDSLLQEIHAQGLDTVAYENGYASNVPVLNFHGISQEPASGSLTIEQFKQQMFALKKAGYRTISLGDFYLFMRGEKQVPKKSILITFDDGRRDAYYNSYNIFKALNFRAVMFVIAHQSLEQESPSPYYLNEKELLEMQASGIWDIEEHTYNGHGEITISPIGETGSFYGNKMWLSQDKRLETDAQYIERVTEDLDKGRMLIESRLNRQVTAFALPFGDVGRSASNDPKISEILSGILAKKYNLIFYQYKPAIDIDYRANYNDKRNGSYFAIRFSVAPGLQPEELIKVLDASREKTLPYTENFSNYYNWTKSWGTYLESANSIVIGTEPDKSALAYIDGSYLWKDYAFSVTVKNNAHTVTSVITRFQDSYNFAECDFAQDRAAVAIVSGNNKTILGSYILPPEKIPADGQDILLEAVVYQDRIYCLEQGELLLQGQSANIPQHGGAGVKISGLGGEAPQITVLRAGAVPFNAGQLDAIISKDKTPPAVKITFPYNNNTLIGQANVNAGASDNIGVSKVEFFANQRLIGTAVAAPYSIIWNTAAEENGIYELRTIAYDSAGNTAKSAGINIKINNPIQPQQSLQAQIIPQGV